ncbi:MAG: ABC transporter ATP-binding protein [Saprospiraceae bacterium]|nr:ABC transporter ATP-binding protein [Saprospiraceae bacterium]
MNKNTVISVENLSKMYHIGATSSRSLREAISTVFQRRQRIKEFWALDDVSFEINKGEAVGIIGHNGAGKSTLLKILSKITQPTGGSAILNGKVASLLEVGTGFHPELTGSENIYLNGSLLGMSRTDIKSQFDSIIDFSGVERFINTPVKHYSSGMYVRLAFSVAAHLNTEILLVDEVLAVGDAGFQKKCINKMDEVTKGGKTILFVSHNESAIRRLTSKAILLTQGKIAKIGSPQDVYEVYNDGLSMQSIKRYAQNDVVKSVKVYYDFNLKIEVDYKFQKENQLPHLGYIVSNRNGEKLFGGNPSLDNVKFAEYYRKEGKVIITVEQPLLRKGTYFVSIFFGNGSKDVFVDENCVSFNVEDSIDNLGFLRPTNNYEFL